MQDLDRAIADIRAMRIHAAQATKFRGYGPLTVALTGGFAISAAWLQARYIAHPLAAIFAWLGLWTATAAVSVVAIGVEVFLRARRAHEGLADDMIQDAALQLLPASGAGVMLTLVVLRYAPAEIWMLPGLWQILFSLGIFSACRNLPAALNIVAFWYLGCGMACLAFGGGAHALSPWTMGAPFGLGEALAAILLAISARGEISDHDEN